MVWQVALGDIGGAVARLNRELPGWWWRVGSCQVSADATIAPTVESEDVNLVNCAEALDVGFDCDLRHPATIADALNGAIDKALAAKSSNNSVDIGEQSRVYLEHLRSLT